MTQNSKLGRFYYYIADRNYYSEKPELSYMETELEYLFVKMTIDSTEILVGIIYRPPNTDLEHFLDFYHQ